MKLSQITGFLSQNKRIFFYIGLFLMFIFLSRDLAFSAGGYSDIPTGPSDTIASSANNVASSSNTAASGAESTKAVAEVQKTMESINDVLKYVGMLIGLITYLVSWFLSPEWINGTQFGLDTHFKTIWILVSNVVYFIFAFLLIWIAFMNIIGAGDEKYQLKQVLPKFIVGVLIVPFSWFIVQFILSLSAVLSIGALTLPFDSFPKFEKSVTGTKGIEGITINTQCDIYIGGITKDPAIKGKAQTGKATNPKETDTVTNTNIVIGDNTLCNGNQSLKKLLESENFTKNIFGIVSLYTHGIISFNELDNLKSEDTINIKTYGDLIVHVISNLLFLIIYCILILALALVLFTRGVYLWIYTMISPVFGLMYFFDKKDGGGDGFFGKFNVKEFISLAMVPVYTLAALSFGMLFMYVVGTGMSAKGNTGISETGDKAGILYLIGDESDIGKDEEIRLTIHAAPVKDGANDAKKGSGIYGMFDKGLGFVGSLIMQVFGIIILWGAIMAAMKSSTVTGAVIKPLDAFGEQVGQLAAKSPGYLPVFGGQSMQSLSKTAQRGSGIIDEKATKSSNDLLTKFGVMDGNGFTKKVSERKSQLSGLSTRKEIGGNINKFLHDLNGDVALLTSKGAKEYYEALANSNIPDDAKKYYKDNKDSMGEAQIAEFISKIHADPNIDLAGKTGDGVIQLSDLKDYIRNIKLDPDYTGKQEKYDEIKSKVDNIGDRKVTFNGERSIFIHTEGSNKESDKESVTINTLKNSDSLDSGDIVGIQKLYGLLGDNIESLKKVLKEKGYNDTLIEDITKNEYHLKGGKHTKPDAPEA